MILHGLILMPLVMGTAARKKAKPPETIGDGASTIVASAEMVSTLTLIEIKTESSLVDESSALAEFASRGISIPDMSIFIASSNPDPAYELEDEPTDEDSLTELASGDPRHRAEMFGRYMGQVSARIERAWIRPRTQIDSTSFQCTARIEQDHFGNVAAIELVACDENPRWQQSLVLAVERASPLSAPPDPSVFAGTLVLKFASAPYAAGISAEDQFEPLRTFEEASEFAPPSQLITNADTTIDDVRRHEGVIELRITGKNTTWTLQDSAEGQSGKQLQTTPRNAPSPSHD